MDCQHQSSSSKTTINPRGQNFLPHERVLFPGQEQLWLLAESMILTIIKLAFTEWLLAARHCVGCSVGIFNSPSYADIIPIL